MTPRKNLVVGEPGMSWKEAFDMLDGHTPRVEKLPLVDENNKTKFHNSFAEATKTVYKLTETGQEGIVIDEVKFNEKIYFTVKNSAGKILKPHNYSPVNLSALI